MFFKDPSLGHTQLTLSPFLQQPSPPRRPPYYLLHVESWCIHSCNSLSAPPWHSEHYFLLMHVLWQQALVPVAKHKLLWLTERGLNWGLRCPLGSRPLRLRIPCLLHCLPTAMFPEAGSQLCFLSQSSFMWSLPSVLPVLLCWLGEQEVVLLTVGSRTTARSFLSSYLQLHK